MRSSISFYLNGQKKTLSGENVFLPLSSFLRYEKGLTGTKVVCAEGDCGACSVMVSKKHGTTYSDYYAVNSCIAMSFSLDGANLVTVEGLQNADELSEVQCSMVRNFGGQCGFCTPGFVMAITNLHEHKKNPTEQNVKNYLTGNLCRCTGYEPIIKAALDVKAEKHVKVSDKFPVQSLSHEMAESIFIKSEFAELFAPLTVAEACEYRQKNPDCTIFAGSTDLGVQFNKGYIRPKKILSLHLIPELYKKEVTDSEVFVGARVTLAELQKLVENKIPSLDRFLNIFASPQIKNSATLVGNLTNASPIADTTPAMMTLNAKLKIAGLSGEKLMPLQEFYLGYKKLNLKSDEIVTGVVFEIPETDCKYENYKVSQRRDLDISTVNASFCIKIENHHVKSARIALGGVAVTTLRMTEIEKNMTGRFFDENLLNEIKKSLSDSVSPLSDLRGSSAYRKILVGNLFEKFAREELDL